MIKREQREEEQRGPKPLRKVSVGVEITWTHEK